MPSMSYLYLPDTRKQTFLPSHRLSSGHVGVLMRRIETGIKIKPPGKKADAPPRADALVSL